MWTQKTVQISGPHKRIFSAVCVWDDVRYSAQQFESQQPNGGRRTDIHAN